MIGECWCQGVTQWWLWVVSVPPPFSPAVSHQPWDLPSVLSFTHRLNHTSEKQNKEKKPHCREGREGGGAFRTQTIDPEWRRASSPRVRHQEYNDPMLSCEGWRCDLGRQRGKQDDWAVNPLSPTPE